ncbi:MAG: hypothetical protein H0U23_04230 [Blastocatellia bacterium]|nr:hypothetical protein [Blastocatellia bacterium]
MTVDAPPFRRFRWSVLLLLVVILATGVFLRAWPSCGFEGVGYDENMYRGYVAMGQQRGITNYGEVVDAYLRSQALRPEAVVPATRVGFLWPAVILAQFAEVEPILAMRAISLVASILFLLASVVIGYRLGKIEGMLVFTALIAVAPLQIYLAQRSLVDGYFAFWAALCAWFFWESLQAPQSKGWIAAYGISLFVLVLTKEYAVFVFVALMATLAVRWALRFDQLNLPLVVVGVAASAFAVLILARMVGGVPEWLAFWRMYAQKVHALPYAVRFQDGAWYRYLIDFAILSPCIVLLASGRIFAAGKNSEQDTFWTLFLGFSFVCLSTVTYGMDLRYAAYLDQPLRWLAASQVILLARHVSRTRPLIVLGFAAVLLVAVDLTQYWRLFVDAGIYDPVSAQLLRASKMIK